MSMPASYPTRKTFWASRFIRLLQKCCAANEIGVEACWLLTVIALVEDSKRYTGPVTFWTNQILPITGFASWGRLDRARAKAVEAGWLHYQAGKNRSIGKYWCTIPDSLQDVFDDTPVDALDYHQNGDDAETFDHQNGDDQSPTISKMERQTVTKWSAKRARNGDGNDEPSVPCPNPYPISCQNRFTDADMQTADFIWQLISDMQPDRRKTNLQKWANSIRLMRDRDKRTDDQIRELFTWCNDDSFWRNNILSPDKLRKQWDDLQLRRPGGGDNNRQDDWQAVRDVVRQKYSPDLRNTADVQAVLTPKQFEAAQTVGLPRIANADKFDKETPAAYRAARKAIA